MSKVPRCARTRGWPVGDHPLVQRDGVRRALPWSSRPADERYARRFHRRDVAQELKQAAVARPDHCPRDVFARRAAYRAAIHDPMQRRRVVAEPQPKGSHVLVHCTMVHEEAAAAATICARKALMREERMDHPADPAVRPFANATAYGEEC